MSGRAQLIQRSRQAKRRRKFIQLAGLLFLVLIAIGLTIYALYRPGWRIEEVRIIGNKTVSAGDLQQAVRNELSGTYFLLAPKDSQFFYSQNSLRQKVLTAFPRVASVDFEFDGNVLDLSIVERESEFLWCVIQNDASKKDCYFVDATGVAFGVAPVFDKHVLFEVLVGQSASTTATSSVLGTVVLLPDSMSQIFSQKEVIHKVLAKQKMFEHSIINSVNLTGNAYLFAVVSAEVSSEPWQIITNAKMPSESLAPVLSALFASASFAQNVVKNQEPLAYVDARLGDKVFFKTLNNHAASPTP